MDHQVVKQLVVVPQEGIELGHTTERVSLFHPDGSSVDASRIGYRLFLKDRIYFGRCKVGDPGHIASTDLNGDDFRIEEWSIDSNKWVQWFKPSPDGSKALVMRLDDSDVSEGTVVYDDYTKSTVELYDIYTGSWKTLIDKPSLLTNPDGSSVLGHGTFHWVERSSGDAIIGFRGPIRTGGANALALWDLDGNLLDIVADITGLGFTDPAVFPVWAARQVPFTTVSNAGTIYIGSQMVISSVGPNQEIFAFPIAQAHEDGVGGLPSGFYKFTANLKRTLTAMTTAVDDVDVSGISPSLDSTDVGCVVQGPGISAGTTIVSQTGTGCVLSHPAGAGAGAGAGKVDFQLDYDPMPFYDGTGYAMLTKDELISGMICGQRIGQGSSGDSTKPRIWFGHANTDRGTPDIVDDVGNFISRPTMLPHLQENGKWLIGSYRYYAAGHKKSWDTGTPASAQSVVVFDVDPRTFVASNPRTIHADDHVHYNVEIV